MKVSITEHGDERGAIISILDMPVLPSPGDSMNVPDIPVHCQVVHRYFFQVSNVWNCVLQVRLD